MGDKFPESGGPSLCGAIAAITLSTLLIVWASPSPDTEAAPEALDAGAELAPARTTCPAADEPAPPAHDALPAEELPPCEDVLSRSALEAKAARG